MRLTARTLLEALTGAWPELLRIGGRQIDLHKIPAELLVLAERAKVHNELLEHLATDVLCYNK